MRIISSDKWLLDDAKRLIADNFEDGFIAFTWDVPEHYSDEKSENEWKIKYVQYMLKIVHTY